MRSTNWLSIGCAVLLITIVGYNSAAADPVAPLPEMTEQGIAMLKRQGKTPAELEKSIPSRSSIGLPVYPDSCFVSHVEGRRGGAVPMLPAVNLVSGAPPEKIIAWYRKNLNGWTYDDTYALFHDGTQKVDIGSLMGMQTITIMAEDDPGIDLIYYKTDNIKSRIIIRYNPTE